MRTLCSPSTWDRLPSLITDPVTGAVTTTKRFDHIVANFVVANYNSLGPVDNDDGCVAVQLCLIDTRAIGRVPRACGGTWSGPPPSRRSHPVRGPRCTAAT